MVTDFVDLPRQLLPRSRCENMAAIGQPHFIVSKECFQIFLAHLFQLLSSHCLMFLLFVVKVLARFIVHFELCLPIPLPAPGIPSAGRQVIIGRRGSSLGPDLRRQCLAAPRGPIEYIGFSTHEARMI